MKDNFDQKNSISTKIDLMNLPKSVKNRSFLTIFAHLPQMIEFFLNARK